MGVQCRKQQYFTEREVSADRKVKIKAKVTETSANGTKF
jgi:hypothetical protein